MEAKNQDNLDDFTCSCSIALSEKDFTTKTLQEKIADFICAYSAENLRQKVWDEGRKFFTDAFGVMIAGSQEPCVQIARDLFCSNEIRREATTVGFKEGKSTYCNAARINAMAAHVHDFDDNSLILLGHPSCIVLPAVLSCGEMVDASVHNCVEAYIMGVDIAVMLAKATFPEHYTRGWHSTATLGLFGATAAVCKLLKMEKEKIVYALGLAASSAAGIRGNNGSMGKAYQAGNAASNALICAFLAEKGFTTNKTAMDGTSNYLTASSGSVDIDAIDKYMHNMESEFDRPGMAMKLYPCCKATHTSIDMARQLKSKYEFAADDVDHIVVGCQPVNIDLLKFPNPKTKFEGKFSMQYTIALGIVRGNASLKDFMGNEIEDKEVLSFMPKITMELDDEIAGGEYSNGGFGTRIHIYLKDGRVLHDECMQAHGDPEQPVTFDEFKGKFINCAEVYMSNENAEKLFDMVYSAKENIMINNVLNSMSKMMK